MITSRIAATRVDSSCCVVRFRYQPMHIWEVPGHRIEMSPFGGIKDSGNGYKRHRGHEVLY